MIKSSFPLYLLQEMIIVNGNLLGMSDLISTLDAVQNVTLAASLNEIQ